MKRLTLLLILTISSLSNTSAQDSLVYYFNNFHNQKLSYKGLTMKQNNSSIELYQKDKIITDLDSYQLIEDYGLEIILKKERKNFVVGNNHYVGADGYLKTTTEIYELIDTFHVFESPRLYLAKKEDVKYILQSFPLGLSPIDSCTGCSFDILDFTYRHLHRFGGAIISKNYKTRTEIKWFDIDTNVVLNANTSIIKRINGLAGRS